MLYKLLKTKSLQIVLVLISIVYLWNCVPVKKQLILKDSKRKTLKELRMVDTTLLYQPFEYKLKSGDVLAINLVSFAKGEYDLSSLSSTGNVAFNNGGANAQQNGQTGYIVNDSGFVIFPVLGKIKVANLSLKEAQTLVQQQVSGILDNTLANITMLNYYVYIMGEVTTQGQIIARRDRLTLVEVIANSGGFTDFADRDHIKIIRNQNNTAHIYYVNMSNQDLLTTSQVYLLPNDVIIVEPLRAKVAKTYTIPNISLIVSSVTLIITLSLTLSNLLNRR
jgi:polysaccharide biosynthesis/export protein